MTEFKVATLQWAQRGGLKHHWEAKWYWCVLSAVHFIQIEMKSQKAPDSGASKMLR